MGRRMRTGRGIKVTAWLVLVGMTVFGLPLPGSRDLAAPALAQMQPEHSGLPHGIPDFGAHPTLMSVKEGPWDVASTWDMGRVPTPGDIVQIHHRVILRTTDAVAWTVAIHGKLTFEPTVNTRLRVVNLMVMGNMGELQIGTAATPIAPNVTAEIILRDAPLDTGTLEMPGMDPKQFGTGLIGFGKVTIHGAVKTPSFVRLAVEPKAGNTTLTLEAPVTGWRPGDKLILPDTRAMTHRVRQQESETGGHVDQWEELTLSSLSPDGKVLSLAGPLHFDHQGARNALGVLEILPHVGNLSRNVKIASENASGTRGHTMFTHRAAVDIRYALFKDLGRTTADPIDDTVLDPMTGAVTHIGTNPKGRYALHAHHLMGPENPTNTGHQFQWIGNAIDGFRKWGIVIHDTHYGLIQGNTLYNGRGSGIVTEDGNEIENAIEKNFVVRMDGVPFTDLVKGPRSDGTLGFGYWFRGILNRVRDNVAADVREEGYTFIPLDFHNRHVLAQIPAFRGADPSKPEESKAVNIRQRSFLEFARNEIYSADRGFSVWAMGQRDPTQGGSLAEDENVVKDFTAWHLHNQVVNVYFSASMVIDGLKVRGYPDDPSGVGVVLSGGQAVRAVLKHADIQNMNQGIFFRPRGEGRLLLVEDSILANFINVKQNPFHQPGGNSFHRWTIFRNVRFGDVPLADSPPYDPVHPLQSKHSIFMHHGMHSSLSDVAGVDTVHLYQYNGDPNVNLQLFYPEQHPDFLIPITVAGYLEAGLTNQQNWAKYGMAIAGAVSPSVDDTTYPEIYGYTWPMLPDRTAPEISAVAALGITPTTATLTWTTNEESDSEVEYGLDTSYGSSTAPYQIPFISHSFPLIGLKEGTPYHYRVKSRDPAGNLAVSGDFTFTTVIKNALPPTLVTQPSNRTVSVGQPATFRVVATGTAPLIYQWQRNGANISGATSSSTMTPATVLADNGATFRCRVTNPAGSITSSSATLTVNPPPPPPDTTAPTVSITAPAPGATVLGTITILANASDNVKVAGVQFKLDGANLGAEDTTNSYSISWDITTVPDGSHTLTAIARDGAGNTSSSAVSVTVRQAVAQPLTLIGGMPADLFVTVGRRADFRVRAVGGIPAYSYQWQRWQRRKWVNIPGATLYTYLSPSTTLADNGAQFRCVVTDAKGERVVSKIATLITVKSR